MHSTIDVKEETCQHYLLVSEDTSRRTVRESLHEVRRGRRSHPVGQHSFPQLDPQRVRHIGTSVLVLLEDARRRHKYSGRPLRRLFFEGMACACCAALWTIDGGGEGDGVETSLTLADSSRSDCGTDIVFPTERHP
jgi:hypothetical protein